MGEVLALEHIAIQVSDLEKSRHFYGDILGLNVLEHVQHDGGAIDQMTATKGVKMIEYRCRAPKGPGPAKGPGFTIDLIQWATPKSKVKKPKINDVPSAHFAFGVKDLTATVKRLRAAGVEIVSERPPVVFPPEEGSWKVIFFRDPDGFLLELIEVQS
jgi:catechol 2,3-dioxygenase-like lactoylglutathione lyase family enzyme